MTDGTAPARSPRPRIADYLSLSDVRDVIHVTSRAAPPPATRPPREAQREREREGARGRERESSRLRLRSLEPDSAAPAAATLARIQPRRAATSVTTAPPHHRTTAPPHHCTTPTPHLTPYPAPLAPQTQRLLLSGGIAGSVAKTVTAPLSRMAILFQVSRRAVSQRAVPCRAATHSLTHSVTQPLSHSATPSLPHSHSHIHPPSTSTP